MTVRIATAFDPQTMDPHALALLYHSRVAFQVYESLVTATSSSGSSRRSRCRGRRSTPKTWRFKLRQGVMFHDGTPFTVDDAVFSIKRAIGAVAALVPAEGRARREEGRRADARGPLEAPDAVLPEKFFVLPMMSRAWSEKNKVEVAQDFNGKQETFAVATPTARGRTCSSATSPTFARC